MVGGASVVRVVGKLVVGIMVDPIVVEGSVVVAGVVPTSVVVGSGLAELVGKTIVSPVLMKVESVVGLLVGKMMVLHVVVAVGKTIVLPVEVMVGGV